MTTTEADLSATLTPRQRALITVGITIAAMVTLLDTAIVSVALAHMQGGLSVDRDQISWVVTAYLVVLAVMTPPTGWLASYFGRKPLFLVSVSMFATASLLCGLSDSLGQIIFLRVVQAFFGAFLVPLTQAAVLDVHPPEAHGRAIALWSFGMTFGSFFGPTLGGYIIEEWSWRGAFFVVVPFCAVAFFLIFTYLPREKVQRDRPFAFGGYVLLALGIAALQLMLDRGEREDWFSSGSIVTAAVVAGTCLLLFAAHSAYADRPFFNPKLLSDRNFVPAMVVMFCNGVLQFTMVTIMPLFLQNMLGYSAILAGYVMTPRAIGAMAGNAIAAHIIDRIDPRIMAVTGLLCMAAAFYTLYGFTTEVSPVMVAGIIVLQGLGIAIVHVPLNVMAFATLPRDLRADGAAVINLLRNVGGSIGVAVLITLLTRNTRENRATLLEQVTPYNELFQWQSMPEQWNPDNIDSLAMLEAEVTRQATLIAYINDFKLVFFMTLAMIPLILLMRRPDRRK
ncbi:MAG: DHA2 family efflux MFS transporter permease subunit [Pseudomonadota bacterium]